MPTNCQHQLVLPTKQGQLRPIVKADLRKLEQVTVWQNAVSMAKGKVPSSSVVAEAVKLYLRSTLVSAKFGMSKSVQTLI